MRATTAFNRIVAVEGASVASVTFSEEGVVVGLRRRRRRHTCPCGWSTAAHYDRSVRRWRHLDLGVSKCFLEAEICRIRCQPCGRVRTEDVEWARPGARHTIAFCNVVAWLAQRVDKTTITRLLRVSWEAVARIVVDVVADQLEDARLDGLHRIGVDKVSFRKGHRYLTIVANHDEQGSVVWAAEGKGSGVLSALYDELGPERIASLEAISMDLGLAYEKATTDAAPHVRQCVDPFHLVALANTAIDAARRWAWNEEPQRSCASPARSAEERRAPTAAQRAEVDKAHPLGAAQGPEPPQRRSAGRAA